MKHRPGSRVAAIAAAALIGISGIAAAQPQPRHHGPHGHDGGGDFISAIAGLKSELNLNTSQQAMWDNAAAAGKAARENARAERQKIRATLDAELAKAEPDLAAVAAAADGARNDRLQLPARRLRTHERQSGPSHRVPRIRNSLWARRGPTLSSSRT